MAVSHVYSNAAGNWTTAVTAFNSQGSTTTIHATNMVRPLDWNSAHNQFYTLSGNTNNASTASGTNVVLQGLGAVTLVGSTGTIGVSVAGATYNQYAPYDEGADNSNVASNGTYLVQPVQFPSVQHDRVGIRFCFSNASNSTGSHTFSFLFGLYTRNVSTISLLASTSTTHAITFSGTVGNQSLQAGPKIVTIPWSRTVTQGDYWVGIGFSFATGGVNNTIMSFIHNSQASAGAGSYSGIFGAANDNTDQRRLGQGRYTAATAAVPNSIAFSQIQGNSTAFQRPIKFVMLSQSA